LIALAGGRYLPEPELQLKAFLAAHRVSAVLVDPRAQDSADPKQRQDYQFVLDALGPAPFRAGGMLIYRFAPSELAPWSNITALELERRADAARFAALLDAAQRYLQGGGAPTEISSAGLVRMGLIRGDWEGGPDIRISNGLWVKPNPDGGIDLGTFGSQAALATLIARYRSDARRIRILEIPSSGVGGDEKGQLELMILTFDQDGLRRGAALARPAPTRP
ncbi:MAG TPA: hypothetical protein VNE82_06550, partial [Candidatus Binataceae bacterium]|nr:hypothetical protein [Candidatus Binataceae bacterium]